MTDTQTALPLLPTDGPEHPANDALGFQPHADRLAAMLLKQQFPDASFVVGIEGEWGEGKSTFINCLKQRFEQAKGKGETPPDVVEFNPWWFENPEKTASNLLEAIINGRDLCDIKAKKALTHLLNALNHVNPWLEKLLSNPVVLAPFFGASAVAAYKSETWFGVAGAAVVAMVCHLGLQWFARQHAWSESLAGLKQKAADALKSEKMKGQKQIVIIDDLDRLSHEEIRQVFRAVKGVLDLPNIVYVIAYDRAIVASALEDVHKGKGEAYLEKIVQLPYRLPKPTQAQFFAYNTALLADFLSADASAAADQAEEQQALNLVVKAFLPQPRDAKRLLAALAVNYAVPIEIRMERLDFLFLESMRLKNQPLWRATLNACLDCKRYAVMGSEFEEPPSRGVVSERAQWVESHFGELKTQEPAVLAVMHYFTGLPFASESDSTPREQSLRGLSHFGVAKRTDDLMELVIAYSQCVLPEAAVTHAQITEFVWAETAEKIAICIKSCVFPSSLLLAAQDHLRTVSLQHAITLQHLEIHLTAVAVFMDNLLDQTVFGGACGDVFGSMERYIHDGLLLVEPKQHEKRILAGKAKSLFLSWLSPKVAPRTVAEFVFSSKRGVYRDTKADVIDYFVRQPLVDFLKTGVAGEMLEFMAGSEGQMDTYRKRWLENLPSPANLSEQEKTLLGVMVKDWSQEVSQDWLIEAMPFMSLVAAVQGSAIEQDKREACRQFVALAERRLSERRI